MKLETSLKLLQVFGALPLDYNSGSESSNDEPEIKISKKYLCCSALQLVLACHKLLDVWSTVSSGSRMLAVVIYGVERSWTIFALMFALSNGFNICRCIHGCNAIDHSNMDTFRTFAFFNLCLQNGSAVVLFFSGLVRDNLLQRLKSLGIFSGITLVSLINYVLLLFLKITLVSCSQVNQSLTALANSPLQEQTSAGLARLAEAYWHTGNSVAQLNRTFGLHILCFSGFTFAKFTLMVYYFSVTDVFFGVQDPRQFKFVYLAVYAVLTLLFDFLLLCVTSQLVTSERHATLAHLQRLLRRRSYCMTTELKIQVRVSFYQGRATQQQLAGSDFFHVNKHLFYGMVMLVISYFILLVQFRIF